MNITEKELNELIPELDEKRETNMNFVAGFLSASRRMKTRIQNLIDSKK